MRNFILIIAMIASLDAIAVDFTSFAKVISSSVTSETLTATDTPILSPKVFIQNPSGAAGSVFIGDASVSAAIGFELEPGESLRLGEASRRGTEQVWDTSKIFVIAEVDNATVTVGHSLTNRP